MPGLLPADLPPPAVGAFTTRTGGASTGPWAQGNLAGHVADLPDAVTRNREALARGAGLEPAALVFADQVHGADVAVVDAAVVDAAVVDAAPLPGAPAGVAVPAVDALVTACPRTALVVLAADCLPVLLVDPQAAVVAAAHAGRQGLVAGVLQSTLSAMSRLGARADRVRGVLGPAVCGACYELPDPLADEVEAAVPGSRSTTSRGTAGVDLAAGARGVLRAAGVQDLRQVGGCTVEQPRHFYSYRRDGRTGRHAGLVWLAP